MTTWMRLADVAATCAIGPAPAYGRVTVVATLFAALFVGVDALAFSHDEGRIIFSRVPNWEIMRMTADGDDLTNLSEHPAGDFEPQWSPDGRRIVFVSHRDGPSELYTMNADGEDVRRLTDRDGAEWGPTWSPDGRRVAYVSEGVGEIRALYIVRLADGVVERIGDQPRFIVGGGGPRWSPDGRTVALVVAPPIIEGRSNTVWTLDLATRAPRRIVHNPDDPTQSAWAPDWSPDGSRIAYTVGSVAKASRTIHTIGARGAGEQEIATDAPRPSEAAWSPDGESIAYTVHEGANRFAIRVARVDGTDDQEILPATRAVCGLDWWGPELLAVNARGKRPFTWGWLKEVGASVR